MTKAEEYAIAEIKASARDIEELNKLQELENIIMHSVINKLSSIWCISAKIDKLYKELIEGKYGK